MSKYAIIIERTDTGYSAYVPDLPGCISTGHTLEDTKRNINEAIEGHIQVMREYGDPVPAPTTEVGYAEVA